MPTFAQIKAAVEAAIRSQTNPETITPDAVSDQFDAIVDKMSEHSAGQDNLVLATAILRPSWTTRTTGSAIGWSFINDSDHQTVWFASLSQAGSALRLNFPVTVAKVCAIIVGVDETLEKFGVVAGPTVALTHADITMSIGAMTKPVLLSGNNTTFVGSPLTVTSSSGVHTVSGIPSIDGNSPYATIFQYYGSNNYIARPGPISGLGAGQMKFRLFDAATGALITTAPTSSDTVVVTLPVYPAPIPMHQFDGNGFAAKIYGATADNANSSGNLWVIGIFKIV